jgi:excinuclease ABC subunit C
MLDHRSLPSSPGVYLFKDKDGETIYIGKANSLRARVSSYFTGKDQSPKTQHLAARIADVDYILLENEVEALLLENRLIKQHKPKYNLMLKDDKTYAYIKVTDERLPRIVSTRLVTKKGTYFGPYSDGSARVVLVKLANELFRLCANKTTGKRACLNYHLGLCSGACAGKVSREEYLQQVEQAKDFLKGNTKSVVERLEQEMREASASRNFELALERRNQIAAIERLHDKQRIDQRRHFDQDIIAFVPAGKDAIFSIFHVRKGVISGREAYQFELQEDIFESFLTQYYAGRQVPSEVVVNEPCWEDEHAKRILEEYLTSLRAGKVSLTLPLQGAKLDLVRLAQKNALRGDEALRDIREKLDLPASPEIIECFDVSNLGREHLVAGMVRFVKGKPDRSGYRRFAIRTVVGRSDDYAALHEAVLRRYARLKKESAQLPDLVLIDGGAGQLSAARAAMQETRVDVAAAALAKQEEELYLPGRSAPLRLGKKSPGLLLLRGIRDTVHRYAIAYNRKKRRMTFEESTGERRPSQKDPQKLL